MKKYFLFLILLPFLTNCKDDNENIDLQESCGYTNFKYYNGTEDYLGELSDDRLNAQKT